MMQYWPEVMNGLHRFNKPPDILYKTLYLCVFFSGEVMNFVILIEVINILKTTSA